MSADNTIVILHTKDGFRVKHVQALDTIYYWYVCCDKPNVVEKYPENMFYETICLNCETEEPMIEIRDEICPDRLKEMFGSCQMFTDKDTAIKEACYLYNEIEYVEYGIQEIYAIHIDLSKE